MKKLLSIALVAGVFTYTSVLPVLAAPLADNALPSLGSAIDGSVSKTGNTMNVAVNCGQNAASVYNWNTFHVGKDASVNFQFNNYHQTALNKVQAAGGMSQIYGDITNSGIGAATGKVFLLNPNGVFFGNGASVNVNSFTASGINGTFNSSLNKLELDKGTSGGNIYVLGGASITGDKAVNLVGKEVTLYKDSLVSTNNANYVMNNTNYGVYGGVKIVTGDGVNFTFINNGATNEVTKSDVKATTDVSKITINGTINSQNIDIINGSTNSASMIGLKNAVLKAEKAVLGQDGSIDLVSNSQIVIADSTLTTTNATGAAAKDGGRITLLADGNISVSNSALKTADGVGTTAGRVGLSSTAGNIVVSKANIDATGKVSLAAGKIATIQNASVIKGSKIEIGGKSAQTVASTLTASGDSFISATNGNAVVQNTKFTTPGSLIISGTNIAAVQSGSKIDAKSVNISGTNGAQVVSSTIDADEDVVLVSTAGNVIAQAATINTTGDVNLNSAKIASIQTGSKITAANVYETGKTRAQVVSSTVTANTGSVILKSVNGSAIASASTIKAANGTVSFEAAQTASVQGASNITAKKLAMVSSDKAQIVGSTVTATEKVALQGSNQSAISGSTVTAPEVVVASPKIALVTKSNVTGTNSVLLDSNKTYVQNNSIVKSDGTVSVTSDESTVISQSAVNAKGNVNLLSDGVTSIQANSNVTSDGAITLNGGDRVQVISSTLTAKGDLGIKTSEFESGVVSTWLKSSTLNGNNVVIDSKGTVQGDTNTIKATDTVSIQSRDANISLRTTGIESTNAVNMKAHDSFALKSSTVKTDKFSAASDLRLLKQTSFEDTTITAGTIVIK